MNKQICIKELWDSSVPNIEFNKKVYQITISCIKTWRIIIPEEMKV